MKHILRSNPIVETSGEYKYKSCDTDDTDRLTD